MLPCPPSQRNAELMKPASEAPRSFGLSPSAPGPRHPQVPQAVRSGALKAFVHFPSGRNVLSITVPSSGQVSTSPLKLILPRKWRCNSVSCSFLYSLV